MDGKMLYECVVVCVEELFGVELIYLFGLEWDVFKVCGKVFMLQIGVIGEVIVMFKFDFEESYVLCSQYVDIIFGYYMNKKYWISLYLGGMFEFEVVDEFVIELYLQVLEYSVFKLQWFVDFVIFGQV